MAAVPMVLIAARRTPAMITGKARGSSTRSSTCAGLMPMPVAASTTPGSTPFSPSTILRTSRNWLYATMTIAADVSPRPVNGMSSENRAKLGTE